MTGVCVGVTQSGSGISLSGTVYSRSQSNVKTEVMGFILKSGACILLGVSSNEFIFTTPLLNMHDRVGFDMQIEIFLAL